MCMDFSIFVDIDIIIIHSIQKFISSFSFLSNGKTSKWRRIIGSISIVYIVWESHNFKISSAIFSWKNWLFTKIVVIYTWLCWLNGRPGIPRWSEPNPRCPRSWAIVCSTRYRLMSSEAAENWGSWDVVVWRSVETAEGLLPAPPTTALPPVISPGDPSPLLLFKGLMVVSGLALKAMKAALLASRLLLFWLVLWACGLWSWSTVVWWGEKEIINQILSILHTRHYLLLNS